jgi:hypothetical protein
MPANHKLLSMYILAQKYRFHIMYKILSESSSLQDYFGMHARASRVLISSNSFKISTFKVVVSFSKQCPPLEKSPGIFQQFFSKYHRTYKKQQKNDEMSTDNGLWKVLSLTYVK